MANPTNTGSNAGERTVAMTATLASIPEVAALRTDWVAANSGKPERILSALGHPGYGRAFSARVLAVMADTGCDTWEAVYGAA